MEKIPSCAIPVPVSWSLQIQPTYSDPHPGGKMQAHQRTNYPVIRKLFLLVLPFLLAGCVSSNLSGKRHDSTEEFLRAAAKLNTDALSQITSLPQPLTSKKLIVAIPSESASLEAGLAFVTETEGRAMSAATTELLSAQVRRSYLNTKFFYEAIDKRKIYSSVSFRDTSSVIVSLEPSADTDVMYMTAPIPSAAQWFYGSQKHGKQVFAFDSSGVVTTLKVNAFLEAVQALAIRE